MNNNNSCNLKLKITKELLNPLLKDLTRKNEISGIIKIYSDGSSKVVNKNTGNKDSVSTPNHVINFHTHPINAYNQGKTVWGWPSGEDIRETVKFALSGNKAHLVVTVEGIYSIQVNPCKIKKLKNMDSNRSRGILIFLMEEYFKCTHNLRCHEEVNNFHKKNIKINPYTYVNYLNHFNIESLFINKKVILENNKLINNDNSTIIPNNGFIEISEDTINLLPINKYITVDDLDNIYSINNEGLEMSKIKISIPELLTEIKSIIKYFEIKKCTTVWNNDPGKWFYVNFFPTIYYSNGMYIANNKHISPQQNKYLSLDNDSFIKIYSNSSDGCNINAMEQISKFSKVINKKNKLSTFGKVILNSNQRYLFYKLLINTSGNIFNNNYIKSIANNLSINYSTLLNELSFLIKNKYIMELPNGNYIIFHRILN